MKVWEKFKNWWLGGDPNDDGHLAWTPIGWAPFPAKGSRGRDQERFRKIMKEVDEQYRDR